MMSSERFTITSRNQLPVIPPIGCGLTDATSNDGSFWARMRSESDRLSLLVPCRLAGRRRKNDRPPCSRRLQLERKPRDERPTARQLIQLSDDAILRIRRLRVRTDHQVDHAESACVLPRRVRAWLPSNHRIRRARISDLRAIEDIRKLRPDRERHLAVLATKLERAPEVEILLGTSRLPEVAVERTRRGTESPVHRVLPRRRIQHDIVIRIDAAAVQVFQIKRHTR